MKVEAQLHENRRDVVYREGGHRFMRRLNLRSWKAAAVLVVVAAGLTVAATGSFASSKAGVVKVAIMTDCKLAFGFAYEPDIGGAQAAL